MISAIIIAAGASSRMGGPKQLLPYKNHTILNEVIERVCASRVDECAVVLGFHRERIAPTLPAHLKLRVAVNPAPEEGMLSSIREGVRQCCPDAEAYVIALGDQPEISTAAIDCMLEAYRLNRPRIVVPTYEGKRGHPVLIDRHFRDEILTMHDDRGMRGLIGDHEEEVRECPILDGRRLKDIDTPEDYRLLKLRLK